MCHPPGYYLHLNFLLQTYMLCNGDGTDASSCEEYWNTNKCL